LSINRVFFDLETIHSYLSTKLLKLKKLWLEYHKLSSFVLKEAWVSIALAEKYKIIFSEPLPDLDTLGGKAFSVESKGTKNQPLYALVQHRSIPQRTELYKTLQKGIVDQIWGPIDQGVKQVKIGGENVERLVTIINIPQGTPFAKGDKVVRLTEGQIREGFLKGMVITLATLHTREIIHRGICPANLLSNSPDYDSISLRECVTAPAGGDQNPLFEPLERCTLRPEYRGEGTTADDIFALGVTVLSLFYGELPKVDKNLNHLYAERVARGSYGAYTKNKKIPSSMSVMLKGLLDDDPDDRWSLSDLAQWMDGSNPQHRASTNDNLLTRPVLYDEKSYTDRRLLAVAFAKDSHKAAKYLKKQKFNIWVNQYLSTTSFSERHESILNVTSGDGFETGERVNASMVARVCAFLDPSGPIRYRGLTIPYDGIHNALLFALAENNVEDVKSIREILTTDLFKLLSELAGPFNYSAQKSKLYYGSSVALIEGHHKGQGAERFTYELFPSIPCLSPHTKNYWVDNIKSMIIAIDEGLIDDQRANSIFEPHVASFLASRSSSLARIFTFHKENNIPVGQKAAMFVEIFGTLQLELAIPKLANLSKYLSKGMKPMIRSLKNRPNREILAKRLMELSELGDLVRLLTELNISRVKDIDAREFRRARQKFLGLEREENKLLRGYSHKDPKAMLEGYRWISLVSLVFLFLGAFTYFSG
jgi:hypothetical protein